MDAALDRLRQRVLQHACTQQGRTAVSNLRLAVLRHNTVPVMTLCRPMVCVVLQGAKQVMIGGNTLLFEPGSCFASTIELPTMGCVLEAEADRPYIAIALTLDDELLASLLAASTAAVESTEPGHHGFGVEPATPAFLKAIENLLELLDMPEDIATLGEGREREVLYRLLQSGHGSMMRRSIQRGSGLAGIRRSVEWLRNNFADTLPTETLAAIAGMSVPSFHRHFKAVTSLSPLQYQKTMRLQAARRLLFTNADVTQAAFAVGYESASQFSREYARLFGLPPSKDALRIRNTSVDYLAYME